MNIFQKALPIADLPAAKAARQEFNDQQADVTFREEVIAELVLSGIAVHVAANMTDTPAKLMAKAREIEYI